MLGHGDLKALAHEHIDAIEVMGVAELGQMVLEDRRYGHTGNRVVLGGPGDRWHRQREQTDRQREAENAERLVPSAA